MGCFQADQPKNLKYGDILRDTLTTQVGLQPLLSASEAEFSPVRTSQALNNLNMLLYGTPEQSFDLQTYDPAVFQQGNRLSYGRTPRGFTGEVNTPPLGTARGRGGSGAGGVGFTGSDFGDAALLSLGGPFGASGASAFNTGNPDLLSSALGVDFFGGSDKTRVRRPSYGSRTVTQGAQPGLIELMNRAASETQAADISRLNELGPQAHDAILAANPELAALLGQLNQQAGEGLDAGSMLTPEEQRWMQQATRASWSARGMGGSNASAADEVLRQYALGQNLLGRRQEFARSVAGDYSSMVENPVLSMLLRQSNALPEARGFMPGAAFNPESPFAGNIASANQQMAALFADPSTLSKINQVSQTTSNVLGTIGSVAGIAGAI